MTTSERWLIEGLDGIAVIFGDGALTIERSDGHVMIRAEVSGVLSMNIASAGPDQDAFIYINFTDPNVVVDNVRLAYTPYRLRIHPKRVDLASRCAADLRGHLLSARRWRDGAFGDPELIVPPAETVDFSTAIDDAASRMATADPIPDAWLSMLTGGLHRTEVLLEMMRCTFRGYTGILAVTHRRVLFFDDEGVTERPLAAVRWVYPQPDGSGLFLQDILSDTVFGDAQPDDVTRVVAAAQRALRRQGYLGSLRPRTPGILELFEQYETVTERAKLGMLSDEQTAHELSGICFAVAF